jgi:hypothetical protein
MSQCSRLQHVLEQGIVYVTFGNLNAPLMYPNLTPALACLHFSPCRLGNAYFNHGAISNQKERARRRILF